MDHASGMDKQTINLVFSIFHIWFQIDKIKYFFDKEWKSSAGLSFLINQGRGMGDSVSSRDSDSVGAISKRMLVLI